MTSRSCNQDYPEAKVDLLFIERNKAEFISGGRKFNLRWSVRDDSLEITAYSENDFEYTFYSAREDLIRFSDFVTLHCKVDSVEFYESLFLSFIRSGFGFTVENCTKAKLTLYIQMYDRETVDETFHLMKTSKLKAIDYQLKILHETVSNITSSVNPAYSTLSNIETNMKFLISSISNIKEDIHKISQRESVVSSTRDSCNPIRLIHSPSKDDCKLLKRKSTRNEVNFQLHIDSHKYKTKGSDKAICDT